MHKHANLIRLAMTVEDLLKAIDYNSSQRAHYVTPNLTKFVPSTGTIYFVSRSAGSKTAWEQMVQLVDFNYIMDDYYESLNEPEEVTPEEEPEAPGEEEEAIPNLPSPPIAPKAPAAPKEVPKLETWDQYIKAVPDLTLSNVKVFCSCFSYQFNGPHYILDQLDSAITPENRFPQIRDINLEHTLCKHLIAVFRRFF